MEAIVRFAGQAIFVGTTLTQQVRQLVQPGEMTGDMGDSETTGFCLLGTLARISWCLSGVRSTARP